MRTVFLLLLTASLCACEGELRPVMIDDARPRKARLSDAEAERVAAEKIRDIEERVRSGNLPKIQFEFDKADLLPSSYPTLDLLAAIVVADARLKLFIRAHTDAVGDDEYNEKLGERRAKAVMTYLAKQGVPPPSMRYRSYGATQPLASNDTDEGRAINRRVEFRVTTRDWRAVY